MILSSSIFASKRASPIFVPESHGFSCRIYSGVILFTKASIQALSVDGATTRKAFPEKIMRESLSFFRSAIKDLIVFFATAIRFGEISSASIDREISNTIMIVFFSGIFLVIFIENVPFPKIIHNIIIAKNRKNKDIFLHFGIMLNFAIKGFGFGCPYFFTSKKYQIPKIMGTSKKESGKSKLIIIGCRK